MRRLLLATPVLLFLAAPAGAGAATVTTECAVKGCFADGVVVVADPGEANRIRVTGDRAAVEVTDAGAPLRAGEGCATLEGGAIRCATVFSVIVRAGDGNDVVELTAAADMGESTLDGGPGDDVVSGGDGPDAVAGGSGRDQLSGGASSDRLADFDLSGAADADVIDGGAGSDIVDYSERRHPVVVRLDGAGAAGAAGEDGERDALRGIEGALGGRGDDVLASSDAGAPTTDDEEGGLSGGPGDDLLLGGRGHDHIDASQGRDRVRAGPGHDFVDLSFGESRRGSTVDCGRGSDFVDYAGPRDVLGECEAIKPLQFFGTFAPIELARGAVRLSRFEDSVRVTVRVDRGPLAGRVVARRRFRTRGADAHVTRLGRRLARRSIRPALRVEVQSGRKRSGFRLAP